MTTPLLLVLTLLTAAPSAQGQPLRILPYSSLGLPASVYKRDLQNLLQGFVDKAYGRSFRHLGDERDFDHGHLLFRAGSSRPAAVLYHTQELAHLRPDSQEFGYLDAEGRNWIQWVDSGAVENARRYLRREYPATAEWEWFLRRQLPALAARHTITEKMLDPALGFSGSRQWEFTRLDCSSLPAGLPDSNIIRVLLPKDGAVCLALSAS